MNQCEDGQSKSKLGNLGRSISRFVPVISLIKLVFSSGFHLHDMAHVQVIRVAIFLPGRFPMIGRFLIIFGQFLISKDEQSLEWQDILPMD